MGNSLTAMKQALGVKKARNRIAFAGLHQAGKTTALCSLLDIPLHRVVPTLGFECEEVQLGEQPLQVWDLQGEPAKGLPRHHYYADMSAVVFFVDSADSDRFEGSARALREILASPRLPASAVLLVLANKQDKPNAHSVDQIQEVLSLDSLSDREWHIAACTATDVTSVQESLGWLGTQVLK